MAERDLAALNWQTSDGLPISRTPPHGATVVVYTDPPGGRRYLILHRAQFGAQDDVDWAWTPPSGARLPGEPVQTCARRELLEETGLAADPVEERIDGEWAVFSLRVAPDVTVSLDAEHDRYAWVPYEVAVRRCRPKRVADCLALVEPVG